MHKNSGYIEVGGQALIALAKRAEYNRVAFERQCFVNLKNAFIDRANELNKRGRILGIFPRSKIEVDKFLAWLDENGMQKINDRELVWCHWPDHDMHYMYRNLTTKRVDKEISAYTNGSYWVEKWRRYLDIAAGHELMGEDMTQMVYVAQEVYVSLLDWATLNDQR